MARKKLTKKQEAAIEQEREAKYQAFCTFRDKYHGKTFQATVRWFDKLRGEGMVRIDEELSLPIYACNIQGRKTWYPETAAVFYESNQQIQVRIDVSSGATFAMGLTAGTLDDDKWNSIKDKNLAFRVNEDGTTTGLFS